MVDILAKKQDGDILCFMSVVLFVYIGLSGHSRLTLSGMLSLHEISVARASIGIVVSGK